MARDPRTIIRARELRKRLTPQEARLWLHLRTLRARGFHFRRQAPLCGYYLDFVCFSRRLIIEADGGHHNGPAQADHDAVRDAVLRRQGFRTLRIENTDIDRNFDGVVLDIHAALGIQLIPPGPLAHPLPPIPPPPLPPPCGEGGPQGRVGEVG